MDAATVLAWLAERRTTDAPAVIVVAHPDDETVAASVPISLFPNLTLVHVTNGAPADMRDAFAAGHETAEEYAAARAYEFSCAMQELGARPQTHRLDVRDQEAISNLRFVEDALRPILDGAEVVFTHAYEGGHPDHDACALAVRGVLGDDPRAAFLEFPLYHGKKAGNWILQRFPDAPAGLTLSLTAQEEARKRAALDCFVTQRRLLARFDLAREVFRAAPVYDFSKPPHPGTLLYERFGWWIDGERWRALAADVAAAGH